MNFQLSKGFFILGFLAASSNARASTHAVTQAMLLEEGLNAAIDVSTSADTGLDVACEQLQNTVLLFDKFETKFPLIKPLGKQLRNLETRVCEERIPRGKSVSEEAYNSENSLEEDVSEADSISSASVWRTQPRCNAGHGPIANCTFRHQNGRGFFTLAERGRYSFPNALACVMNAGSGNWLLESDYVISSRCLVSSVDWRAPSGRSDVLGLFQWLEEPAARKPIELPSALANQCESSFPEAAFCSPTLLVLPSKHAHKFDVCGLHTRRHSMNGIVFRIATGTSKWKCETKDLRVVDEQKRLSDAEWHCVPNRWGNVSNMCLLPYIPTTKNVRSRESYDTDVPINP
jgi:hypothetical protein